MFFLDVLFLGGHVRFEKIHFPMADKFYLEAFDIHETMHL